MLHATLPSAVGFTIVIPPDPSWTPFPIIPPTVLLPAIQLFPARTHEDWVLLYAHLPTERRMRIVDDCRRRLWQTKHEQPAKDGDTGELFCPESCKDAVCGYCENAREEHSCAQHLETLLAVEQKTGAGMLTIEATIDHVEWALSTSAAGCLGAETQRRLCKRRDKCGLCDLVRSSHDRACQIERQVRQRLVALLRKTISDFMAIVIVRPGAPNNPFAPTLTIRMHIPLVAVHHDYARITSLRGKTCRSPSPLRSSARYIDIPDLEALAEQWTKSCAREHYSGTLRAAVDRGVDAIERQVRASHIPLGHEVERALRAMPVVSTADVRTVVRRIGLTTETTTGKARRQQRVTWVGGLAGTEQEATLNALDLELAEKEPAPARVAVDCCRAVSATATHVTLQSEWSGIVYQPMPRTRIGSRPLVGAPWRDPSCRWRAPIFVPAPRNRLRNSKAPIRAAYNMDRRSDRGHRAGGIS